jgi:tetratricopeptide (TPR) repeat protein
VSISSFRKAWPLVIGLFFLAPTNGAAQVKAVAADALAEGDFLVSQGLPDLAITVYLGFLFDHPASDRESDACHRISRAYLAQGDGAQALHYADRALSKARGEAERKSRAFARAELLLALNRSQTALLELALLDAAALSRPERGRVWFLQGVASTYLGLWQAAAGYFRDYFALSGAYPPHIRSRVLKLLSFGEQSRPLDPEAARLMSYLLPGSGQAYAGDPFEGLNSLLVTGAAGALVVWAVVSGAYFDAATAAWFVFARFYTGSPYHGARLATERNESRKQMISRAVLDLLAQ